MIYCPYELPNNAETESQTPSELATVDAGYGGCLSRYLVAGVAFEAPSTCKQLTPQITAICDGARDQPAPKLQVSLAPSTCKQHRQWVAARRTNGLRC